MLAVVQRINQAKVSVAGKIVGQAGQGFLVFLGVVQGDTDKDLDYLVQKISQLRVMADKDKKMNLSLKEVNGEVLVVSQFTLAANVQKGNRPSFISAADQKTAQHYYQEFISRLKNLGLTVASGQFGAYMKVELTNDGPVTIILNSKDR